ncbi:MAG TPA: ArsR family transcriptional regulator [Nitrososphaerales archaeon]|jgi:predicted transcriptional regulator|nr:winged helix-turn-helix domain-containing protein [Nitrososphaerales archaeon]NSL74260.1 helix-turn-helix transcriptional regulator [Nitrososphaerota archaeon]NSL75837.1 helix-turn-helix transcriptional regulator [Nitrososphaerota archaeon]NSL77284.1 helix-turn-helix transcriptional regulator [Nitrososphaerota archaeon]HIC84063.1 ArsR family transcriptional regulator [Nitrososphaerales archaeon]
MIITNEKQKEAILNALLDDYSRKILDSTIDKAKSITEIIREQDIPMTSTYRRVKLLMDNKLIKVERSMVTEDGKRYYLYLSSIKNASIKYNEGELIVEITPNIKELPEDKLIRSFTNIQQEAR